MPSPGYSYNTTLVPQHVGAEFSSESTNQIADSIVSVDASDDIILKPQALKGKVCSSRLLCPCHTLVFVVLGMVV